MTDEIPQDVLLSVREQSVGIHHDVTMVTSMTCEQARQVLDELELLLMDTDLTPDETTLRKRCVQVLTEARRDE